MEQELETSLRTVAGCEVKLSTYKVGARYGAKVESADGRRVLGRGTASTREDAGATALTSASLVLELQSASSAFRAGADRLRR